MAREETHDGDLWAFALLKAVDFEGQDRIVCDAGSIQYRPDGSIVRIAVENNSGQGTTVPERYTYRALEELGLPAYAHWQTKKQNA